MNNGAIRARRSRERGFSLIEVLIILVIIGILMAIAISQLLSARDKARQGATIADMRNISTAIEAYTVDYSLPPAAAPFPLVAILLRPYHNTNIPVNDHWGHVYSYETDPLKNYSLISFGKDGIDGDELTPTTRFEFERDIIVTNGRFPGLP